MKLFALIFLLLPAFAQAGQVVEYKSKGVVMEGYLALPEGNAKNRPAVLIVHDWMGQSDFTKAKADEMAKKGYVAFSADIYGKGIRPKDSKEASELAGKYKADRKLLRERINAALETLNKQASVDKSKVVAFGYCFGGTTVLELGRSGAKVAGIATFHGGLETPDKTEAKKIKGKVLVLHGAIDPFVPETEVLGFQKEMNDAKVDYQFISYSDAVHSFTIPGAGNDPSKGAAYNEKADKRSAAAFAQFLNEIAPL